MAATLDLIRSGLEVVEAEDLGIFRLSVSVDNVAGIDENIFVFREEATPLSEGDVTHKFMNVASLMDMADYPVGAPNEDNEFPFFRKNTVTLDLRSTADLEYAWTEISSRVQSLLTAVVRADNLTPLETLSLEG